MSDLNLSSFSLKPLPLVLSRSPDYAWHLEGGVGRGGASVT